MNQQTLGNSNAKHAYEIEIATHTPSADLQVTVTEYSTIKVLANNRTQAASIAKKNGYFVRSVNMIG